jgi:hypothetical protein
VPPGPPPWSKSAVTPAQPAPAKLEALAIKIAKHDYSGQNGYTAIFRYPSISLMIKAGLWLELDAAVGFILGLGLASLMGQRLIPVILMIVLQLILTPILAGAAIPHLQGLQRSFVGLAMAHLEPSGLPIASGVPGVSGGVGGPGAATRVGHPGHLGHHRLAGGLDDPRRMANDDQGHMRDTVLIDAAAA